jgi:hypothetical protein
MQAMPPINATYNIIACNTNGNITIIDYSVTGGNPLIPRIHNNNLEFQYSIVPLSGITITINGVSTNTMNTRTMSATSEGTDMNFTPTYTSIEILRCQTIMNQVSMIRRAS